MRAMRPAVGWSLELSTVPLLKPGSASARALRFLPAGTRVYLPSLPSDPPSAIEDALALLRRENSALLPVPHIAATREESAASLERRIARWQRASSDRVREALVVRGESLATHSTAPPATPPPPPASPPHGAFRSSLELLESGALQRCGIETVGLCGHPEGVGGISAAAARAALADKLRWAEASGVTARVVTQFTFFSGCATEFVDALRADGFSVPVSLGVVGPSSLPLRQRMAERCGVGAPQSPYVTPFLRRVAAWQAERAPEAGVQAIHLYPFGGVAEAMKWLRDFADDEQFEAAMTLDPPPPDAKAFSS